MRNIRQQGAGKGRFYANGETIASTGRCCKVVRLALLQQNHISVDITGCHYSILASRLPNNHPAHRGVKEAREFLKAEINHPERVGIAKLILHCVVTTSVRSIRRQCRERYGYTLEGAAERFLEALYTPWNREKATKELEREYGSLLNYDRVNERNKLYKLCEAVETQAMLSLIEKLLENGTQSIIWLHD